MNIIGAKLIYPKTLLGVDHATGVLGRGFKTRFLYIYFQPKRNIIFTFFVSPLISYTEAL